MRFPELTRTARSPRTPSPTWRRVAAVVDSPVGDAVAFGWGFAEAVSWPVIAEMELALLATAVPKRTSRQALLLAAGSVCGVTAHVWLRRRGVRPPLPLTTSRMQVEVASQLAEVGPKAFWRQQFNGIPVKVYAAGAADTDLSLTEIAAGAAAARGTRIVGLGLVATWLAGRLQPAARGAWGPWMVLAGLGWSVGQRIAVRRWR